MHTFYKKKYKKACDSRGMIQLIGAAATDPQTSVRGIILKGVLN